MAASDSTCASARITSPGMSAADIAAHEAASYVRPARRFPHQADEALRRVLAQKDEQETVALPAQTRSRRRVMRNRGL